MNRIAWKIALTAALSCVLLLMSRPAEALRCENRLILEGMHEAQVFELCGEPVSIRPLGLVLRSYYPRRYGIGGIRGVYYDHGYLNEVLATEVVYNFGPRKLMRILRFEGGYLVDIDTAGYGYLQKDKR
jgi:hypothetical protein